MSIKKLVVATVVLSIVAGPFVQAVSAAAFRWTPIREPGLRDAYLAIPLIDDTGPGALIARWSFGAWYTPRGGIYHWDGQELRTELQFGVIDQAAWVDFGAGPVLFALAVENYGKGVRTRQNGVWQTVSGLPSLDYRRRRRAGYACVLPGSSGPQHLTHHSVRWRGHRVDSESSWPASR